MKMKTQLTKFVKCSESGAHREISATEFMYHKIIKSKSQ